MASLYMEDQDAPEIEPYETSGDLLAMLKEAHEITQDDEPHHTVDDGGVHTWLYCDGGRDVTVMTGELDNMGN